MDILPIRINITILTIICFRYRYLNVIKTPPISLFQKKRKLFNFSF